MNVFEPSLALTLELPDRYTLHSVTIAPNTCFHTVGTELGLPPGHLIVPEALPVMLRIGYGADEICLRIITPVRHQISDLHLGGGSGKTSVVAFAMLDGMVVGVASVSLTDPARINIAGEG